MTRTTATRLVGLVALGGVAALGGSAACSLGSVASAETPVPGSTASGTAHDVSTAIATSVSFAVDLHTRLPAQRTVHLLVHGQMDFVHHTLTATVTVPTSSAAVAATSTGTRPAAGSITLHTEWVNRVAYMSVPSSWTALAHGAGTLSLPISPSLRRAVTTTLTQSAVALTYAKLLLDELTDRQEARHLGSRIMGGVPVTGTEVDLTLAQLLKLVPELSPTMTKAAARMADKTSRATVWVDHQGRLVEVDLAASTATATATATSKSKSKSTSTSTSKSEDEETSSVTGTMRFSDYGAPAAAPIPPPGTVKPIPPALRQMLGGWYYF